MTEPTWMKAAASAGDAGAWPPSPPSPPGLPPPALPGRGERLGDGRLCCDGFEWGSWGHALAWSITWGQLSMGMMLACLTRKSCPVSSARTSRRLDSLWFSTRRPRQPFSSGWLRSPRMATCTPTVSGVPLGATGTMWCEPFTFSVSGCSEGALGGSVTSYRSLSALLSPRTPTLPLWPWYLPSSPISITSFPACRAPAPTLAVDDVAGAPALRRLWPRGLAPPSAEGCTDSTSIW
mmetsp:Transcript_55587/g.156473  ORF Transcript_55587/g.156473 Transcript_55587/m.156473 type:complete len:236 (+) Transcript_55587:717-1424(+)